MPAYRALVAALLIAPSVTLIAARQGTSPQASANDPVAVGLSCNDGTVVPLVTRTKGKWTALIRAQEDLFYFSAVLTREALRLPRHGWTLYPQAEQGPRPFSLRSPRTID